ncbi:TrmH family RNA methyltransferase [Salinarimonas rosea]|uniref:TrmH family RNA methyltransferase n=1 Tax=Salinarimonas rosea TaxID=552063 RepID=UPI00040A1595|nr:TrmH family RNA methyltransferase [Salinarimonas rosea]
MATTSEGRPGGWGGHNGVTGIRILLVGVRSPINTGMILRVAETYEANVALCGADDVLDDPVRMQTIRDFSCGALERRGFTRLSGLEAARAWIGEGRLVATTIAPDAVALPAFRFRPGDVIAFGSEYDGLDPAFAAAADAALTIPMPDVFTPKPPTANPIDPGRTAPPSNDGRPNLNVAMSVGITCYAAYCAGVTREG